MKIVAGLGNPGSAYAGHRHNVGFMALDRLQALPGMGPWRSRFQGLACDGTLGGARVLLLKPQTFMNLSGQSVSEALRFLKLAPSDLTVVHDDIDLAPGRLKVKTGGGHAGHNGLRSISQHIGDAYHRVRIGVGHPGHKDAVAPYVLHDFSKADGAWLDALLRGIEDGAEALARQDWPALQNAVALRAAPPPPPKPRPGPPPGPPPDAPPDAPQATDDPRSVLRRLADRFR